LKKVKAIFELDCLVKTAMNEEDIPAEAVECSAMAMNVIQSLYTKLEEKRNYSMYL
jgi:hypothetical protein